MTRILFIVTFYYIILFFTLISYLKNKGITNKSLSKLKLCFKKCCRQIIISVKDRMKIKEQLKKPVSFDRPYERELQFLNELFKIANQAKNSVTSKLKFLKQFGRPRKVGLSAPNNIFNDPQSVMWIKILHITCHHESCRESSSLFQCLACTLGQYLLCTASKTSED